MTKIICKLFGYPKIYEDEKEIFLPTGKLTAFFYYILLKKVVSRDEVAGMFWASSNEQNAKISLRNALHKIRKSFREDVILSPNKSILTLNKDLDIEIDVEKFQKDPLSNFEVYTGDFLKGFYVKESIDFDYWVLEINTFYKELFIKTAEKKIEEDFLENKFESLETSITSLLANDNFNDKAYLYLMKFYKQKGRYDKIINEYKNIEKLMEDELGIEPPNEIKKIYKEALNFIEKGKEITLNKNKIDVYCRDFELDSMQVNLNNFEKEHSNQSILITGESGIGKTFLKKEILNRNKGKFKIFETACFSMEKDFSYLPWMNIIKDMENELLKSNLTRPNLWDKILKNLFFDGVNNIQPSSEILENKENFNVDLIYNSIYSALDILSKNKKIIIVFEDIQWADQLSIKLLINLILHIHSNIIFILTKTNGIDTGTDRLFLTLKDLNKILAIDLNPFSKREIELIIKRNVSQKKINDEEINEIFEKSKGNPFFLSEYIELFKKNKKDNEITSKLYNVLQDKFLNLTEDEMNILKIISVFYGDVNLDTLLKLINLKPFETLKILNLLIEKNIIEEKKKDNEVIITISEGTNLELVEKVKKSFIDEKNIEIVDIDSNVDHNRTVFTYKGEPSAVLNATKKLAKSAVELIDMRTHKGSHPRMGAVDVVPFIPVKNITTEEAVEIAKEFGKYLGELGVPVYFYEDAQEREYRKTLPSIRKGQYEALEEKMKDPKWAPDEGPKEFNAKSGGTVTGARFPLIAFNINLDTYNLEIGKKIVKAIRSATGGYSCIRAIALELEEKKQIQVSMNMINYEKTPIHRVFETIKSEANRYNVNVVDTELVGPVPIYALRDVLDFYLRISDSFSVEQIYF